MKNLKEAPYYITSVPLIHLHKSDRFKGGIAPLDLKPYLSDKVTEKYIEKEVQSVIRIDMVEKYRIIKFKDMKLFFKSLSLEEEKEYSKYLKYYMDKNSNTASILVREVNSIHKQSKQKSGHTSRKEEKEIKALQEALKDKQIQFNATQTIIAQISKRIDILEQALGEAKKQEKGQHKLQGDVSASENAMVEKISREITQHMSNHLRIEHMRRGYL